MLSNIKKNRIIRHKNKRYSCLNDIKEIWNLISSDFLNIMGLYKEFSVSIKVQSDYFEMTFLDDQLYIIKDIEEYGDTLSVYKNNKINNYIQFEIDINFKNDLTHYSDGQISRSENQITTNSELYKIFFLVEFLSDMSNLLKIKEDLMLGLIFELQYLINEKIIKIKNKNILLLDSLTEEIMFIKEHRQLSYEESKHYVLNYHKHIFRKYSYEKFEELKLSLDCLYDNIIDGEDYA